MLNLRRSSSTSSPASRNAEGPAKRSDRYCSYLFKVVLGCRCHAALIVIRPKRNGHSFFVYLSHLRQLESLRLRHTVTRSARRLVPGGDSRKSGAPSIKRTRLTRASSSTAMISSSSIRTPAHQSARLRPPSAAEVPFARAGESGCPSPANLHSTLLMNSWYV